MRHRNETLVLGGILKGVNLILPDYIKYDTTGVFTVLVAHFTFLYFADDPMRVLDFIIYLKSHTALTEIKRYQGLKIPIDFISVTHRTAKCTL